MRVPASPTRSGRRNKVSTPVKVVCDLGLTRLVGSLVDLDSCGLGLCLPREVNPGSLVRVRSPLCPDTFLWAECRWSAPSGEQARCGLWVPDSSRTELAILSRKVLGEEASWTAGRAAGGSGRLTCRLPVQILNTDFKGILLDVSPTGACLWAAQEQPPEICLAWLHKVATPLAARVVAIRKREEGIYHHLSWMDSQERGIGWLLACIRAREAV